MDSRRLTVAKSVPAAQLAWTAHLSAASYELTRGVLGTLRSAAGDGFWCLVRGNNCARAGTYDEGAASQSGSRDAEIGAAPLACP